MIKYVHGDTVHVEGVVEVDALDSLTVLFKSGNGLENRVRVPKSSVKHHERGPLRAGEKVFKKIKTGRVEGEVIHRLGDEAWVRWGDDAHTVESVSALSR
ncbi:hypothetical protein FF100_21970 [Methylobacterium terricola]|uniref:Uncharacterized protein n=1 Tax=Methylobacterium terricola TaxID=2583531 RepID=A0A5C4LCS5_9HYPH|nr:hypothetical protein [Methylobacterium terricola]TNC10820.1 hypothetical protein FF100_21970 [Methylobacterium terricola]